MKFNINKFKKRIVGVLKGRRETFKEIGEEKPVGEAGVIALFFALLTYFLIKAIELVKGNESFMYIFVMLLGVLYLVNFCILHMFIKLLNGKRNIISTISILFFSAIPVMIPLILTILLILIFSASEKILLTIIGPIYPIFAMYSIILLAIGISVAHGISKLRASIATAGLVFMILIPVIGTVIMFIIVFVGIVMRIVLEARKNKSNYRRKNNG